MPLTSSFPAGSVWTKTTNQSLKICEMSRHCAWIKQDLSRKLVCSTIFNWEEPLKNKLKNLCFYSRIELESLKFVAYTSIFELLWKSQVKNVFKNVIYLIFVPFCSINRWKIKKDTEDVQDLNYFLVQC